MRTSPSRVMPRMSLAAPGLRDMPSEAAEVARPCAVAPAAAAIPSRNAAPMTPHRTPVWVAAALVPVSCANAGTASTRARAQHTAIFFSIPISLFLSFAKSAKAITALFEQSRSVLLVSGGPADVHRGQEREDVRLKQGREDTQGHHRPGNDDRNQAREHVRRRVLAEDVHEQTQ